MPYPVPPSEPPAIVRAPLPSAKLEQSSPASTPHLASIPQSPTEVAIVPPKPMPRLKPLAQPTPPEIFKSEYTATISNKRAAELGSPISVGVTSNDLAPLNDIAPNSVSFSDASLQLAPAQSDDWQFKMARSNQAFPSLAPAPLQQRSPQKAAPVTAQRVDLAPPLETPPSGPVQLPPGPLELPSGSPSAAPTPDSSPPAPGQPATQQQTPVEVGSVIELTADQQTYDSSNRVFTARGNVLMRFRGGILKADQLRVNLGNRVALAEGNVVLNRGQQVLQGNRLEYNFIQGTGVLLNARGVVYTPSSDTDLSADTGKIPVSTLGDRLQGSQPPQNIVTTGDTVLGVGAGRDAPTTQPAGAGALRRIRYEAERVDFTPGGWVARNIRLTNDPFSPPELELRADQAQLTQTSPNEAVLETTQARLVFDQGFSLPLLQSRTVISRQRRRTSGVPQVGYDETERGGLFLEQTFDLYDSDQFRWSITPQILVQRLISGSSGFFSPNSYGLTSELVYNVGPRTTIRGNVTLPTLDLDRLENLLRTSIRAQQLVGDHTLSFEYSYRDRLFNGSLGFQDVQSSLGVLFVSPVINLGGPGSVGPVLTYQAGLQAITADTDRANLLPAVGVRRNNRVTLGRFQATAELTHPFVLWRGDPLPPTPDLGMKYTSTPLVPYVQLTTQVRGVTNSYSNGDNQQTLTGSVGLEGQFGNFSRPFLDYSSFYVRYSQSFLTGLSPFFFDRAVDNRVLSAGFLQQVYGPFRVGAQTAFNLDTGREISTDYILEYSRRTYGITLRYNPTLQFGFLGLRISDFNWTGGTESFGGREITPVEDGVRRVRN